MCNPWPRRMQRTKCFKHDLVLHENSPTCQHSSAIERHGEPNFFTPLHVFQGVATELKRLFGCSPVFMDSELKEKYYKGRSYRTPVLLRRALVAVTAQANGFQVEWLWVQGFGSRLNLVMFLSAEHSPYICSSGCTCLQVPPAGRMWLFDLLL